LLGRSSPKPLIWVNVKFGIMKKRLRVLALGIALLAPVAIFASSNSGGNGNEGERRFWGWETQCCCATNYPSQGCQQLCSEHFFMFWIDVYQTEEQQVPC
jgi:hypothetical protein